MLRLALRSLLDMEYQVGGGVITNSVRFAVAAATMFALL
jgi:hypothetical protein